MIRSCSNQRYSSVFTYLNDCNEELNELAAFKQGDCLQIKSADSFFTELLEQVTALKGIDRNVPLSKEIAIERMKKYLSLGDEGIISMNDLLSSEFDKAIEILNSHIFSSEQPSIKKYDEATKISIIANEIIVPLSILIIRWGNMKHENILLEELYRLFDREIGFPNNSSFYPVTRDFNHIASVIVFYSIGLASVKFEKYSFLDKLFHIELRNQTYSGNRVFNSYVIDCYNEWLIDKRIFNNVSYSPFLNQIYSIIYSSYFANLHDNTFRPLFCIFERLMALYYASLSHINSSGHINQIPIGTLRQSEMYNSSSNLRKDYDGFFRIVDELKDKSEVIKQGMFKGSYSFYSDIKTKVDEYIKGHPRGF